MDEQLGRIAEWNDERGFGFITPLDAVHLRVFLHIRDYQQDGRRPEAGELVKFSAARQPDGKWRAMRARRAATSPTRTGSTTASHRARTPRSGSALFPWLLLAAYTAGLAWAVRTGRLPEEAIFVFAILSALAYLAYSLDKHAAQTNYRRTRESTLHALELAGGWPGALAAQQVLRHKTRKQSYRVGFWCMVLLNLIAVAGWMFTRA